MNPYCHATDRAYSPAALTRPVISEAVDLGVGCTRDRASRGTSLADPVSGGTRWMAPSASGYESQHRAGGEGHGQLPLSRTLLVSVTGAGISPQRCWAPCRVMPSRRAMSAQE